MRFDSSLERILAKYGCQGTRSSYPRGLCLEWREGVGIKEGLSRVFKDQILTHWQIVEKRRELHIFTQCRCF